MICNFGTENTGAVHSIKVHVGNGICFGLKHDGTLWHDIFRKKNL